MPIELKRADAALALGHPSALGSCALCPSALGWLQRAPLHKGWYSFDLSLETFGFN